MRAGSSRRLERRHAIGAAAVAVAAGVVLAAYGASRAWESRSGEAGDGRPGEPARETAEHRSPSGRYVLAGRRVEDLAGGRSWPVGRIDEPRWSPGERYLSFVRHGFNWGPAVELFVLDLARPASSPRRVLTAGELQVRWIGASRLGFWREDILLGPTDAPMGRSASIGIVTPGGRIRTIHEAGGYGAVTWSPRGDSVTYTLGGERQRVPTGLRPRRRH